MYTVEQVLNDVEHEKCWNCGKNEMYLDEEGGLHQGFICKSCGSEVILEYERILTYPVVLFDNETEDEIEVYK